MMWYGKITIPSFIPYFFSLSCSISPFPSLIRSLLLLYLFYRRSSVGMWHFPFLLQLLLPSWGAPGRLILGPECLQNTKVTVWVPYFVTAMRSGTLCLSYRIRMPGELYNYSVFVSHFCSLFRFMSSTLPKYVCSIDLLCHTAWNAHVCHIRIKLKWRLHEHAQDVRAIIFRMHTIRRCYCGNNIAFVNLCVSAQYSSDMLVGSGAVQEDSSEGESCQTWEVVSHCNQIPRQEVLLWLWQPRHIRTTEWCMSHGFKTCSVLFSSVPLLA